MTKISVLIYLTSILNRVDWVGPCQAPDQMWDKGEEKETIQ